MNAPEYEARTPFASPGPQREPQEQKPWGSILRLARYQRWVAGALLLNVPLTILFLAVVMRPATFTNMLIARLFLSTMLLAVVVAYHVGSELYSQLVGTFLMLVACVPGLSIGLLALSSHQAIRLLRSHQVKVSMLGTSLTRLRERAKQDIRARSEER